MLTFVFRDRILLAFSAVISLALLAQMLFYARYGLDVTDESFYLLSISNPEFWRVNVPASLFGFVYHPVSLLLDGDISAIRQANILLSFLLSFLLCVVVSREFLFGSDTEKTKLFAFSLSLSSLSLLGFNVGLLTPNYNSLAFQGILTTAIGLICRGKNGRYWPVIACFFIAVGGWLTFMAKPSSAAALAISILVCSCFLGRKYLVTAFFSGCVSFILLLITAIYIDGSVDGFSARLTDSVGLLQALGGGHNFSRILRVDHLKSSWQHFFVALPVVFIIIFIAKKLEHRSPLIRLVATLLVLGIGCFSVLFAFGFLGDITGARVFLFAFAISLVFAIFFLRSQNFFAGLTRRHLIIGVLFLLIPHIYALGANGNYWSIGAHIAIFWVLSALVFVSPTISKWPGALLLVPLVFVVQMFSSVLIDDSIAHPYRQPHSLRKNAEVHQIPDGGNLVLSDGFHRYFSDVQMAAQRADFRRGMNAIDLTGQSPGIFYLIGARSLGQPWMVGNYPGSHKVAILTLGRESCDDIASAWLLVEPGGPRSLSIATILNTTGGNINSDYEVVASFFTAEYAGGYADKREQWLLRPKRSLSAARDACLRARKID